MHGRPNNWTRPRRCYSDTLGFHKYRDTEETASKNDRIQIK